MAKKKITCEGCGDTFEVYPYRADTASFCSRECRRSRVTVTCKHCEENFQTHEYREDDAEFCSLECKGDWQSEHQTGKNHPRWSGGGTIYECEWCDKSFEVESNSSEHRGRFCSTECYGNWRSENLVGKANPTYVDGSGTDRPKDWSEKRRKVLERDGYECQTCGISEEAHIVMFGRSLDVHHVEPRRISEDDSLSNLISLCRTCHRRLENRTWRV